MCAHVELARGYTCTATCGAREAHTQAAATPIEGGAATSIEGGAATLTSERS